MLVSVSSTWRCQRLLQRIFLSDQWIDGETKGIDPGNITDGVEICSFLSSPLLSRATLTTPSHHFSDEGLIEQFYNQLSAVSRMKPYMVGPGNHEGIHAPYFALSSRILLSFSLRPTTHSAFYKRQCEKLIVTRTRRNNTSAQSVKPTLRNTSIDSN